MDFPTFLRKQRVIPERVLAELHDEASPGEPLYYQILKKYPDLEDAVWMGLAGFLHTELVDPQQVTPDPALVEAVPAGIAHQHAIVPLSRNEQNLEIAVADPRQFGQLEELSLLLSRLPGKETREAMRLTAKLAKPSHIRQLSKQLYGIGAETVEHVVPETVEGGITMLEAEVVDLTEEGASGEDAAIIRFVNQVLLEGVKIGASDIHLEPLENDLRVRYRVDGILQTEPVPPKIKELESAIISRIKIMAKLNIAEKRQPQDGQIRIKVMGRPIDVRVSILPTLFGQGLVLRLLDRQIAFRQLGGLGMPEDYLGLYRQVLQLSHGVILVTGPTGSGKTTTLYASIHELDRLIHKIITVEDPIEYQLEGITQIQVNPLIHLTFETILRNILRHDPDIIMVGEIRDTETARISISAAMTGHLVFSTLHTNDAPSAPVRLLEMGVEPYLVSSSLEAVVAQRLIRLLCAECKQKATETAIPKDIRRKYQLENAELYQSRGCPACRQSGYKDRTAIFEMFVMNDRVRQDILHDSSASQRRQEAMGMGMRTLFQSGLEKVRLGETTLGEVHRVAREERIDMKDYLTSARHGGTV